MSNSPPYSATSDFGTTGLQPPLDNIELGRMFQDGVGGMQHIIEPQEITPIVRPSRAFRHFKNPPQPHMCIRDRTGDGQELFINVMSWTRIVMPINADDPIPLYGGMRVSFYMLFFLIIFSKSII